MHNAVIQENLEAKINERRDDIEDLAETDLPAADLAEALLEVADK